MPPERGRAYQPFRPRRGRGVALASAVLSVVVFALVAVFVPGADESSEGYGMVDRVAIAGLGVLIAALLWRYAQIRAVPDRQGLDVHNVLRHHRVEWSEILSVQFSGGAPWLTLDLADTDHIAVMAIQKADGPHARSEAARLVALVQHHGSAPEPPAAP